MGERNQSCGCATGAAAAWCVSGVFGRICNVSDLAVLRPSWRVALLGSLPEGAQASTAILQSCLMCQALVHAVKIDRRLAISEI